MLIEMAKRLETAGANVLAMPCNTAHAYADQIRAATSIPLLDMIGLTASRLSRMQLEHRRVGLLASTAVKYLGLYERALDPVGITVVYPNEQTRVMRLIKAVKRGETGAGLRQELAVIANDLRGTDVLVVACTELSVLVDDFDGAKPILDSLDVLVEEVVTRGLGSRPCIETSKEFHTSHAIGGRG